MCIHYLEFDRSLKHTNHHVSFVFVPEVVFSDGQVGDYIFMGTHVYSVS